MKRDTLKLLLISLVRFFSMRQLFCRVVFYSSVVKTCPGHSSPLLHINVVTFYYLSASGMARSELPAPLYLHEL